MTLTQVCEQIKELIKEIISRDKNREEQQAIYDEKEKQAVIVLREAVKDVVGICLKHKVGVLIWDSGSYTVIWHKEYGLAINTSTQGIKPLSGNLKTLNIDTIAEKIKDDLQRILQSINQKCYNIEQKTRQVDNLIKILQDFDKD